jgi:hypothetical protein
MTSTIERDERTIAVENAGYRLSYMILSFGLLILVAYRSFVRHESAWDLLGLTILGGLVNAAYQGSQGVLYRRWMVITVVTIGLAALIAVMTVLLSGTP